MIKNNSIKKILKKVWEGEYPDNCDGHHEYQRDYQEVELYIESLEKKEQELIKYLEKKLKENEPQSEDVFKRIARSNTYRTYREILDKIKEDL